MLLVSSPRPDDGSESSTPADNHSFVLADDHTRVKLMPVPGQKKTSDYINANYIDGFRKCNAYIGTQGPLEDTRETFWRMIWEQNVFVIVMITNLVERGRVSLFLQGFIFCPCTYVFAQGPHFFNIFFHLKRKCDIYWPKEDTEVYGHISAQLEKEEVMADYTVRTIKLKHLKVKNALILNTKKAPFGGHVLLLLGLWSGDGYWSLSLSLFFLSLSLLFLCLSMIGLGMWR